VGVAPFPKENLEAIKKGEMEFVGERWWGRVIKKNIKYYEKEPVQGGDGPRHEE